MEPAHAARAPVAAPTTGAMKVSPPTAWKGTLWAATREVPLRPVSMSVRSKDRCAGTNTSSMTTVWLPVARIPTLSQVSRTVYAPRGRVKKRSCGGPSPPPTAAQTIAQSAKSMPLTYAHWPVTCQPPSTALARPAGIRPVATTVSGPAPHRAWWPSSGRWEAKRAEYAASDAHHAEAAQPSPTETTARVSSAKEPSVPPKRADTKCRANPASRIASVTSRDRPRPVSASAACRAASSRSRSAAGTSPVSVAAGPPGRR